MDGFPMKHTLLGSHHYRILFPNPPSPLTIPVTMFPMATSISRGSRWSTRCMQITSLRNRDLPPINKHRHQCQEGNNLHFGQCRVLILLTNDNNKLYVHRADISHIFMVLQLWKCLHPMAPPQLQTYLQILQEAMASTQRQIADLQPP